MLEPDEYIRMKEVIHQCTAADRLILDELRAEVLSSLTQVRAIQPRSTTSVSLVASDGGNNQLVFDPFYVQLVRVVDSYGKSLCLEAVSPTTDLDLLSSSQFNQDRSPRTALGRMMFDLQLSKLNQISPMIPDGSWAKANREKVSPSWVQVYRDLCEWAALYDRICYHAFATNTLLVRDGLLRSKIFRGNNFIEIRKRIENAIERIRQQDKRYIFLVGIAKKSKVLTRYSLAISLEGLLPPGNALFARVPRTMEAKAYVWPEYARGAEEETSGGEAPKFVAGDMYFVRFGSRSGDPIWTVDSLSSQSEKAQEIFGYLLSDAIDGFPVPFYPRCLQRAHEFAQIAGFDLDILQTQIIESVRSQLPDEKQIILDALPFQSDVSERRYG
jgi:hypothetical protein